jgi:peptidoglycan biosynthesis protein MviN/MurJ (putative lipid II flippase)
MAKNPKYYLCIFLKILNTLHVFFLKGLAQILQEVCKIPKDFSLHFKNIKNLFPVRKYIIHF